jgi:diacylglycerol O-acyltransferase / wax synthase
VKAGTPLRAADEANLVLDHAGQVNVFLAAGFLTPGGFVAADGTPDLDPLRRTVACRLAGLPSLCRVPVSSGRGHRWVERYPDLRQHIRLLPDVAGQGELERLCGELMVTGLTRTRPLWELLVARSAERGEAAFILRIHHAIADGLAAVEIVRRLLDAQQESTPSGPDIAPRLQEAAVSPRRSGVHRTLVGLRRTIATLSARGVGDTVLLGGRSAIHSVTFVDADLGRIGSHAERNGATVNDALLTAAAAGYRAALAASGEPQPSQLPISVPVALRRRGEANNAVGVMLVRLPLAAPTADDCLMAIAAQTRHQKVEARQLGTLELMRGPVGARIMDRIARRQHLVAGFVSNVPGPNEPLRLADAVVSRIWPVAVLAANVRLGITALSYAGRLSCGIHCDGAFLDGVAVAAAVQAELDVLSR